MRARHLLEARSGRGFLNFKICCLFLTLAVVLAFPVDSVEITCVLVCVFACNSHAGRWVELN